MMAERVMEFGPTSAKLQDPETGTFQEFVISKEDRIRPFQVEVDIVANLEELKAREFEKSLLFHGMKLMSDERLVRDSGHSNAQTILAELPALKRQQALEALAAAAVGDEGQGSSSPGPSPAAAAAQKKTGDQRAINKTLRPRQQG